MIESSGVPKDVPCWNPAFNVTPAEYITGIITTEKGVWKKLADAPQVHRGWYNPMGHDVRSCLP